MAQIEEERYDIFLYFFKVNTFVCFTSKYSENRFYNTIYRSRILLIRNNYSIV